MPAPTLTSIQWPPAKETHLIITVINGTPTTIPANQTANVSLFSGSNATLSSTRAPPTTVFGADPPPPFNASNNNTSDSEDGPSKSIVWRNWGIVIGVAIALVAIGGVVLKKYKSGRNKKQEPGNFVTVSEDDGEIDMGGSLSYPTGIQRNSVNLTTLVGHGGGTSNNTVRERRNSMGTQGSPKALDLDRLS
ncbi:hypothetical protein BGW38_008632 [Lunasporangiospora selenospora]|uniref:Uncharacterized protein n=1 Tax=Lunasporangiospora selenospora TaxID=979761 RepID=A0A9P6KIV5_9FUNG|nr:hypothetical protein BGW38_008632 [Lunasporangiospora selenospora]